MTSHNIYGIRHLGPGSAANLLAAFADSPPDLILVEGPSDGTDQLRWIANVDLVPPVAVLSYDPNHEHKASSFPFAEFSPEWVAFKYAADQNVPARFFDLPQKHRIGRGYSPRLPAGDVLADLAKAAGFPHYIQWWNTAFEQRQPDPNHFSAVMQIMQLIRETDVPESDEALSEAEQRAHAYADQREAWMRQSIRAGLAEGYSNIAVICGAWHGPALLDLADADGDAAILQNMPIYPVEFSWVPWTYGRLTYASGYAAGIAAPNWYRHLWQGNQSGASPADQTIAWVAQTAQLLRDRGEDATPAHVIETIRLADALAVMRDISSPGLPELEEATVTVMGNGNRSYLQQIQHALYVGDKMGNIPADMPLTPLQHDLIAEQQRLRLRPEIEASKLALDLRKPLHLDRSRLLHRLNLLEIPWGVPMRAGNRYGTYKEVWQLQWQPAFLIRLIENNMWGSTIYLAASSRAEALTQKAPSLKDLTTLLDQFIQADLPDALTFLSKELSAKVAVANNIPQMVAAIPPLLSALRYGSIRKTESALLQTVIDQLIQHSLVGLPVIVRNVDDAAASELLETINTLNSTINTLDDSRHTRDWEDALRTIHQSATTHGMLAGRVCRLLLNREVLEKDAAITEMQAALSSTDQAGILHAANWISGFLHGNGLLIVHDDQLWNVLDGWIQRMSVAKFNDIVPLLRRTFSDFNEATKQRLRDRARNQSSVNNAPSVESTIDVLPTITKYLGLAQ